MPRRPLFGEVALTNREKQARRRERFRTLAAENAALRAALRCIAADYECDRCDSCRECGVVAREALEKAEAADRDRLLVALL